MQTFLAHTTYTGWFCLCLSLFHTCKSTCFSTTCTLKQKETQIKYVEFNANNVNIHVIAKNNNEWTGNCIEFPMNS